MSTKHKSAEWKRRRYQITKNWRKNNPDHARALDFYIRLRKYGVSVTRYLCTLLQQNFRCARCRKASWGGPRIQQPAVDHDHQTHTFRGLLCLWCNQMLGHLGDDAASVRRETGSYLAYLGGRL